jgi:hypothetical protein
LVEKLNHRAYYRAYGSAFLSNKYEIRIIEEDELTLANRFEKKAMGNRCSLHIVDRTVHKSITWMPIQHNISIKGYCFEKVDDNTHYLVTYSGQDVVFSTITKNGGEEFIIDQFKIKTPAESISACFDEFHQLHLATHEGRRSVLYMLDVATHQWLEVTYFAFKEWGMMDYIFLGKDLQISNDLMSKKTGIMCTFSVSRRATMCLVYLDQGNPFINVFADLTDKEVPANSDAFFMRAGDHDPVRYILSWFWGNCFQELQSYAKADCQGGYLAQIKNYFSFEPSGDECYYVYSPDGRFLMSNMLIKEKLRFYVKTSVSDAINGEEIVSTTTPHSTFGGVGFSNDSADLLFFYPNKLCNQYEFQKIPLVTDQTNDNLIEFNTLVGGNLATLSLMRRLAEEVETDKAVALKESDVICAMLREWATKSPQFREFMKKCFPFYTVTA